MLSRRVFAALAADPSSWLVLAVSTGGVWLFHFWFSPGLMMSAASLVVALLLLAAWPLLKLRDPDFAGKLVRGPGELDADGEAKVQRLEAALDRLGADQGVAQLHLLRQKLERLVEVLRHRLDEGEVTYGRYLGTAEQVYLAALDNLNEVVVTLTSLAGIDESYLRRREAEIAKDGVTDKEAIELATIRQRQAVLLEQRTKVEDLLGENERALAVLDNTSAALAGTRTRGGHAKLSAEEAIRELEALAGRTGRYASGR